MTTIGIIGGTGRQGMGLGFRSARARPAPLGRVLARRLEPLTAVLLSIDRRYKISSGIAVAGARGEHMRVGN
ncbi:hypothetical protein [Kribbella endophytica]